MEDLNPTTQLPPCARLNTPVIAVWPAADVEEDGQPMTGLFSADEYAEWAETNYVVGAFRFPIRFYGITTVGTPVELSYSIQAGPYDGYAVIVYTWFVAATSRRYAQGSANRGGNA